MANRTVRVNLAAFYALGNHLVSVLRPVGAFEVTAVRYYCTTVDVADIYVEVTIHDYNTNWDWGETPHGETAQTTLQLLETADGSAASPFLADGYAVDAPEFSGQDYSAAHEFSGGPSNWGAILFQADKVTGAVTTKVSASPQGHLTQGDAIAALPAPDSGNVRIGYQTGMGPWTANTSNAITSRVRSSLRSDGSQNYGMNDWLEFANGTTRTPTLWGPPETESPGPEVIAIALIAYNEVNFTGAWVEIDFTDESSDQLTARGEARAVATVTSPAPPTIGATTWGVGRAVAFLTGPGGITASSRGEARANYTEGARVTTFQVSLIGQEDDGYGRVTHLQVQQAGHQNPEDAEARVTHAQVQLAGNQNPEESQARVTWLSVQMLRVRGFPDLPLPQPPVRPEGCTMYRVIRAGEEESGVQAERGTYRRLSGDIFLYRRELLQRLRMAYFDAEDYSFTLTIPQGGP